VADDDRRLGSEFDDAGVVVGEFGETDLSQLRGRRAAKLGNGRSS